MQSQQVQQTKKGPPSTTSWTVPQYRTLKDVSGNTDKAGRGASRTCDTMRPSGSVRRRSCVKDVWRTMGARPSKGWRPIEFKSQTKQVVNCRDLWTNFEQPGSNLACGQSVANAGGCRSSL